MREYINIVKSMNENETKTLSESLRDASEFEIDLILESMEKEELLAFSRKLFEFSDVDANDLGLLTKIGAKVFGQQWASEKLGAMQAMEDLNKFNSDWSRWSARYKQPLTVQNLKKFVRAQYKMSEETVDKALKEVQPTIDPNTNEIENIDQIVPELSYQFFLGVGDAVEKRAEENHIDIVDLGFNNLPNNETKPKPASPSAQAVVGDDSKTNQPKQPTQPEKPNAPVVGDNDLNAATISKKMGATLNSLHVSSDARRQTMDDAKKGFQQSFSKNSRTLAAIGYSYLKAIGAA